MKWKNVILALLALFFAINAQAQTFTRSGDTSLSDALKSIERQTGYLFVYDSAGIDSSDTVSLNFNGATLEEVLNALFPPLNIRWEIDGKNIVLTKTRKTTVGKFTMAGEILENGDTPIVGAAVQVVGKDGGVLADEKGRFVYPDLQKGDVLKISCLGFREKTVPASNTMSAKIYLMVDSQLMEEVVVIGYGSLERKDVTSSIVSLSGNDIMKGVAGADVTQALQGKIPGLVIGQQKSVNSGTSMQLRGMASIVAGNSPLVVIDGFPGGDIRSLNPDDIKSIDVLKDASAGAIYGTRAAAGVILVTTKSGYDSDGVLNVTYNGDVSFKQAYGKPKVLTADQYREHGVGMDYGSDTDWWDESINHENVSHKHNVSVNFGTENAKVFSSFFYERMDGLALGERRNDFGGRINAAYEMFDGWFELKTNIDYRQSKRSFSSISFGQALLNNPTRSPYDSASKTGYNVWTDDDNDYNTIADNALYDNSGKDIWFKPEAVFKLNVLPVKGLSYQQTLGYSNIKWDGTNYMSMNHRLSVKNNVNGTARIESHTTEMLNAEGYFSYDNTLAEKHKISSVLGYSYYQYDREYHSMSNSDFSVDGIGVWDIGKGSYLNEGLADMSSYKNVTEKLLAFFARVNYTFDDRYIVSATYRREGSSKFGPKNRWGNFWALSAGWNMKNEKFLRGAEWLDELKIRAGYGVTGNNNFDATYTGKFISADENRWIMPDGEWLYTYGRKENVNETLGWESKGEFNIGLDYSLFKRRLYGRFDLYHRYIKDMLFYVRVPVGLFIRDYQWQNVGSMENRGWEIELGGDIIRGKDFTWKSSVNFSHSYSWVHELDRTGTKWDGGALPGPNSPGKCIILSNDSVIGQWYMYEFAGFNKNGEFLLYDKNGNIIPNGSKTGDDRKLMGSFVPKVMIGWSHNFSYRNFDLGINMHSWLGFKVFNTYTMSLGIANRNGELNVLRDAYGIFEHIKGEKLMSDYYLEEGSFLKVDAITLGYNLSLGKLTKDYLKKIRVYATLANPFIITAYKGLDPEVNITGYDGGIDNYANAYPNYRTYSFGIQLNF
ncbi:MAG: SusC/RagA family TonB-linked outer membrane protein [Bacteroidales bacterium]|nr:SusC/RagA family TonB-linked outer membrane protein [Bacteroidales bacterium]